MTRSSRVFLGGIPGAGKTTLLASIQRSGLAIRPVIAGALLASGGQAPETYQRQRVADQTQAEENQERLVRAFNALAASERRCCVVLDGHFVVPTEKGLAPIQPSVLAAMGFVYLAILLASPDTIYERLKARPPTSWWDGSLETLRDFQSAELRHAEHVANALSLPLKALGPGDSCAEGFRAILEEPI
jgi:adenylate kinase